MRVLILGATGLLGRVLAEEWDDDEVVGASSREADLRNLSQLQDLFAKTRPEVTVLAAAYTDVDGCEKDPKRAYDVNCTGAIHVAQTASLSGSRLVFISTDYVFDGSRTQPYEAEDAVCPMNVYGNSKANAERGIREVLPDCCIVRTSWLFGANGRCFPNTILEAAQNRKKLAVVNDQTGCPTFNRDLGRAIQCLVRARAQGTIHVTNKGACTWYELAYELVRVSGFEDVTVEPVSSSQFPRPARRPFFSVLSGASRERYGIFMRSWQETLNEYFADRDRSLPHRELRSENEKSLD